MSISKHCIRIALFLILCAALICFSSCSNSILSTNIIYKNNVLDIGSMSPDDIDKMLNEQHIFDEKTINQSEKTGLTLKKDTFNWEISGLEIDYGLHIGTKDVFDNYKEHGNVYVTIYGEDFIVGHKLRMGMSFDKLSNILDNNRKHFLYKKERVGDAIFVTIPFDKNGDVSTDENSFNHPEEEIMCKFQNHVLTEIDVYLQIPDDAPTRQ